MPGSAQPADTVGARGRRANHVTTSQALRMFGAGRQVIAQREASTIAVSTYAIAGRGGLYIVVLTGLTDLVNRACGSVGCV